MSRFVAGNLFLLLSMLCASSSQVLFKILLGDLDPMPSGWNALRALLTPDRVVRGGLALGLLVAGFLFWLAALARLDLSYAYPIACASVLFVALMSAMFLGEALTPRMWLGTILVLAGVALLTPNG